MAPQEPPAKHHLLFCDAFDQVIEGKIKRLMVLEPPGSAKSTYGSIRAPACFLGRTSSRGVICASNTAELAESFGRKVRNLVDSVEYRSLYPTVTLSPDLRGKGEWETATGGFYFAAGVGGTITGRRADLIIIDDPIKGREDADSELSRKKMWAWYVDDLRTRRKLDGTTAIVLIQTRWHGDDLAGRILPENWNGESGDIVARDGETWRVICLPAQAGLNDALGREPGEWLWPEVTSPEIWKNDVRGPMVSTPEGVRSWQCLYQQTPTAEQGINFKREWFDLYRYTEIPKELNVYMSGDFAVTEDDGDYTELAVWGVDTKDNVYALDWWEGQTDVMKWRKRFIKMLKRWRPIWFVSESGVIRRSTESGIRRSMRKHQVATVLHWLPHGKKDKVAHSKEFAGLAQNGQIRFPQTLWAEAVIDQLLKFPGIKRDDKVDACSLFARQINATWEAVPATPEKPTLAQALAEPMRIADFAQPLRRKEW